MKKILTILLLYPLILIGQKLDYAEEFAYDIHRNLDYAGNGNIRQALDIYIPQNRISEELPVVVYIHGGGWRRGSKNYAGRGLPFLRTGRYIFAAINYRLVDEAPILEMVYDCKAAIRYLKSNAEKYGIDKSKIGVWGTSAGGHLSAMIGLTSSSKALEGDIGNFKNENNQNIDMQKLDDIHNLKTGKLIECAVMLGQTGSSLESESLNALRDFSSKIGLAFQITDDILDVTQIESVLGKNKNSDAKNNKLTYIDIIGLDEAKVKVNKLTNSALNSLSQSNISNINKLVEMAKYLIDRES